MEPCCQICSFTHFYRKYTILCSAAMHQSAQSVQCVECSVHSCTAHYSSWCAFQEAVLEVVLCCVGGGVHCKCTLYRQFMVVCFSQSCAGGGVQARHSHPLPRSHKDSVDLCHGTATNAGWQDFKMQGGKGWKIS